MADLAAKRMEARRRRIFENSEDRLKRITGLYSSGSDDHSNTESASPEISLTKGEPLLPSSAEVSSIKSREVPIHRTVQSYMETPPPPEHVPITENSLWQHTNYEINDKESSPFSGFQQEPEAPVLIHVHPLIRLRLHIIALAIVVRALLTSPFSFFIAQSAVVPLLTVELVALLHERWTGAHIRGSVPGLFSAALLLSGLPYTRVKQVTTTFALFKRCFDDFCLYFFVFVFTHAVLEMFI